MPKLRGENIPRGTGRAVARTTAGQGEVMVTCPRAGCDWQAIRPEYAAWSAGEAHRINHAKGMV